jgi:hypothetical protein
MDVLFGDLRAVGDALLSMLALVPVELSRWTSSGLRVVGGDDRDIVVYC